MSLIYSAPLIEPIAKERLEFNNWIQAILTIPQLEKSNKLPDSIKQLFDAIKRSKVECTGNPVLNAIIKAEMIFAREKGIEVVISGRAAVDHSQPDLEIMVDAIRIILELFVDIILITGCVDKKVFLKLDEDENHYYFWFNLPYEVIKLFLVAIYQDNTKHYIQLKTEVLQVFKSVKRMIKKTSGVKVTRRDEGGYISEFQLIFKKNRRKTDVLNIHLF